MMEKLKLFLRKYWEDTKIRCKQAMEEDNDIEDDDEDDYECPGVNPSTGMPMISSGVDCTGTPFGTSDWSERH